MAPIRSFLDSLNFFPTAFSSQKALKGNIIARKAGTGRVKATEIDEAIGSYIPKSAVLNTDTARNYQNFALINGLKHELINDSKKERVRKGIFHIQNVNNLKRIEDLFLQDARDYLSQIAVYKKEYEDQIDFLKQKNEKLEEAIKIQREQLKDKTIELYEMEKNKKKLEKKLIQTEKKLIP